MFFVSGVPLVFAADAPQWSVQYLIDNSRTVFGRTQKVSPRENRGLALSPDGRTLYAGYVHSFNNSGEVRRIVLDVADYERATVAILLGVSGKAIATDDTGRVYLGGPGGITVYDADLGRRQSSIAAGPCEGVATAREAGQLVVYATDRDAGTVQRWAVREEKGRVTSATPEGWAAAASW
jgi:DNA-binding beta-propeller fold protein YncE